MGELADELLSEPPTTTPKPIAAKTATMSEDDFARTVTVEIYEVTVREHDTFMNWSLSTPEGVVRIIGPETWMSQTSGARGEGGFTVTDTDRDSASMVALEIPESDSKTLWPLHRPVGADGKAKDEVGCLCSAIPDYLSQEPQMMNGLYPKLPDGVDTVSLKIRGYPLIENIPVTRS